MVRKYIVFIAIILLLLTGFTKYYVSKSFITPVTIDEMDLEHINKLIIVAHPDDELVWGGSHLIDDDYLVVCITCGNNPIRAHEFVKVMEETNDTYIMLGYPDKKNNKRSKWDKEKDQISNDLERIIKLKKWDLIVTHNPSGEYGHEQHIMTNKIVTNIYNEKIDHRIPLYYFGKYYSKRRIQNMPANAPVISIKNYQQKIKLLKIYQSQNFINSAFDQMFKYENWINSKDWR